jgi:hypothetical protein
MTSGDEIGCSDPPPLAWTTAVLEWELAERRIILPSDLQFFLGAPTSIIRVRREIDHKQRVKHADTLWCYEHLSALLLHWEYVRFVHVHMKWEIAQWVTDPAGAHWPLLTVIGKDRTGSYNLVSSHRKNERWGRKLQDGLLDEFVER